MNMKRIFNHYGLAAAAAAVLVVFCLFGACRKAPIVYGTSNVVNITGYLDEHPDSFSEFRQMLTIAGCASFLDAYGNYTLFLPTNEAVNAYLKQINKDSVSQMDPQEVTDIVKFHILHDSVYTISFTDGKLPVLTLYGQYLTTGARNVDGNSSITVNRQAAIIQPNIRTGNGVIHVIDHLLVPAQKSVAELVAANPRYSIFTAALKATGLYDSLNILPTDNTDSASKWQTLLAESDSTLNAAGYTSLADLEKKYSNTGNPLNPLDSLHLFMDYHILYGPNYLADIISSSSFQTRAPSQVITSKEIDDSVLINDDIFNGVHEPGVLLSRTYGDRSATNGVLQDATGHFAIKVRVPFPVYWDVCKFPEIMNLPAYYGKQDYEFTLTNMPSFINCPGPSDITYRVGGTFVNGDYLRIPLGERRSPWVELTTPLLVKGKYKVWICYRTAGRDNYIQVSVDGVALPTVINHHAYMPISTTSQMLAQGWKYYTAEDQKNWAGRLAGTVNITYTGTHVIRFTNLQGSDNDFWLDMIEFIPADMDQLSPRFAEDGTAVY
jgi:uncharacterized surface protein with fasciclin (FAS1) repeats